MDKTLHLQKGNRSISITHSEWNNFIRYISKILENLDPCKDSKFRLSDENLYVTISKHQAHKYVGFHRGAIGDGSGVTMDMDEWGEFLECVAERVIEELNESHPNFHDLEIRDIRCWCHSGAGVTPVLVSLRCWCHTGVTPVLVSHQHRSDTSTGMTPE